MHGTLNSTADVNVYRRVWARVSEGPMNEVGDSERVHIGRKCVDGAYQNLCSGLELLTGNTHQLICICRTEKELCVQQVRIDKAVSLGKYFMLKRMRRPCRASKK